MSEKHPLYETYYRFNRDPFPVTVEPDLYFPLINHNEALQSIYEQINGNQAVAVVLGETGIGKTMLFRKMLSSLSEHPETYNIIYLDDIGVDWTTQDFLTKILDASGFHIDSVQKLPQTIEQWLKFLTKDKERTNVFLIDNVHRLTLNGQFQLLSYLDDFEINGKKIINMVLFADNSWENTIQNAEEFKKRVSVFWNLAPIKREEFSGFIQHRLDLAGYIPDLGPIFTPDSMSIMHAFTKGHPGQTVILSKNILTHCAANGIREIKPEVVTEIIEKTMPVNPETRARIAAVVMDDTKRRMKKEGIENLSKEELEKQAHEIKAGELLLKNFQDSV